MFLNAVTLALIWYYFNILAITGIIYMMLKIALARAERATVNQSESKTRADNLIIKTALGFAVLGIVFFFMREYSGDFMKFWEPTVKGIQELINE